MRFDEERPYALQCCGNGHAAQRLVALRQEQFRGVFHAAQPVASHFVDAQFRGRPEAVLDAAQNAVEVLSVALELQHRVHNVFEHLGACYGALLRDVAHQNDGHAALLGIFQQGSGALANLRDGARRRVYALHGHRLYGVNHHQFGLHSLDVVEHALEPRFAEQQHLALWLAYAVGAQFYLPFALLAAHVEHASASEVQHRLQQQCRLAYARFAANECERARHHAAPHHAVEFAVERGDARLLLSAHLSQQHGSRLPLPAARQCAAHHGGLGGLLRVGRQVHLLHRVPVSACGAFARPLGGVLPAVGANVHGFRLGHTDIKVWVGVKMGTPCLTCFRAPCARSEFPASRV